MLIRSVPSLSPPGARARSPQRRSCSQTERARQDLRDRAASSRSAARCRPRSDVNLHVRRGETLGVVGESGSGKSTVARCIARLIDPTAGAILLEGADIAKLSTRALRPHRKRVQIVFQDPYRSLNPRRTVGAAIIEGPINFGIGRERRAYERARELMRLVGLDPERARPLSRTSSPAASASASASRARSRWSRRF